MNAARDIEQQAAHWLVAREQPGWSADRESVLQAWLNESVAHKAAFWRLEAGWNAADRLAAMRGGDRPPAARWWLPAAARAAPVWAIAAAMVLVCMAALPLWQFALVIPAKAGTHGHGSLTSRAPSADHSHGSRLTPG
ncbi:MAG: hypothetical protein EOP66_06055 [Sphingomonas sp.]|nr:MAG: hypothetical protein EOP66_06055 [Sphingomonas sp.]